MPPRDVNVVLFAFAFKKKTRFFSKKTWPQKKLFFFANFVASGNTDSALLFPGF